MALKLRPGFRSSNVMCDINNQYHIDALKVFFFTFYQKIEVSAIEDFYGTATDVQRSSESGYILFYQTRDV